MRARRDAAIKLLKSMMVASIVLPAALFSYASWVSYKSAVAHTDEQLGANLDTKGRPGGMSSLSTTS